MSAASFLKVAFDGTQDYVDVTLPNAYAASNLQAAASSSSGPVRVRLTNRTTTSVRVEPSVRFTGVVVVCQASQTGAIVPPASYTAYSGFQLPIMSVTTDSAVFIRPYQFIPEVTSFKLHVANKHAFANVGNSLVSNISIYVSDPTASNKCGALIADYQAQTIPGNGTELVLGPIPVTRGTDGKIVVVYSIPLNTGSDNLAWGPLNTHGYFKNHATATNPPPTPDGYSQDGAFWIHVEYATTKRRFAILGDSLSIASTNGSDASLTGGYEASPYYQLGVQKNFAVDIEGYGGAYLADRANPTSYPNLWTYPVTVDDVIIELCTNDVILGTAASITTNLLALIALVRAAAPSARIWAVTGAPAAYYSAYDSVRVAYNTDLRANFASYGIAGIADYDVALRDPANHSQLLAAYTVEGTHWTPAGNAAALTCLIATLGV